MSKKKKKEDETISQMVEELYPPITTEQYIKKYGIDSDINRRQYCANEGWYGYYCEVTDCIECAPARYYYRNTK